MANIYGNTTRDTLSGTDAADTIIAELGNDSVFGGSGSDLIYGNTANEEGFQGKGDSDTLDGGAGSDSIYGGLGNDSILGGNGTDFLYGGNGSDILSGGDWHDLLNGGNGNDFLVGGSGHDILYGQDGNDTLDGGQGQDKFVFNTGDDADVIRDFNVQQDILEIDGLVVDINNFKANEADISFVSNDEGQLVIQYGNVDQITLENILAPNEENPIVNGTVISESYQTESSEISAAHFGEIYTTFTTFDNADDALEAGGFEVGHIRWPGAGLTENKVDANGEYIYSLTHSDILNKDGKGLSDILEMAVAKGLPFSMIIPTRRYEGNTEEAQADLKAFLEKLLSGGFGELPNDFTLELGNESFNNGSAYGDVANSMLTTIREVLADETINPLGFDFTVGVQSAPGLFNAKKILAEIDIENYSTIDEIISHHLEDNPSNFGFEELSDVYQLWSEAFATYGLSIDQNFSAWNVGKPIDDYKNDGNGYDYYDPSAPFDVSGVSVENLLNNDIGARHAGSTIEVFSKLIAHGADKLSLWGTVKHENAYFWHKNIGSQESISHGGHAMRLMNESLIGTTLISGTIVDGEWSQDHSSIGYDSFAYADNGKVVVFITAEDIDDELGLEVTFDLSQHGNLEYAWAEIIRTVVPDEYSQFIGTAYQRLFEVPIVTRIPVEIVDGIVTYKIEEDYEVARIIATSEGSDEILEYGLSGTKLEGNTNQIDELSESESDTLYGGDGDDLLHIGEEVSVVYGGDGADEFIFTDTSFTIIGDFEAGIDKINLSELISSSSSSHFVLNDEAFARKICMDDTDYSNLNFSFVQIGDDVHLIVSSSDARFEAQNEFHKDTLYLIIEDQNLADLSLNDFVF